ncbi:MAG: patatin-like phospholipase family protein [Gallionellaceae bacterium]
MIKMVNDTVFSNNFIRSFIACALLILVSGCTSVVTKKWPAASKGGYPEQELGIIKKNGNGTTFGIAFSGGGTRAASATLGQLQALDDLGIVTQANYISAVSGGAWASVPYIFLPSESTSSASEKNKSDKPFLGTYVPPSNLCDADLEKGIEGSLATAMAEAKFSFFTNNFYFSYLKFKGDETYASYLGNIFLRPFKLKKKLLDGYLTDREYFTLSEKTRSSQIAQNKKYGIELTTKDFYTAHKNRPFLIVNSTLMAFHSGDENNFVPVEITPMYVGIPIKANLSQQYIYKQKIYKQFYTQPTFTVGGYVEPLAYDSRLVASLDDGYLKMKHANPLHGFSLSDVLAATGSAPQQTLHKGGILNIVSTNLGFPEFVHWSEYEKNIAHTVGAEFDHGDGGHLDNFGIMPLLARKVDNILVFINTQTAFREDTLEVVDDLTSLFELDSKYTKYTKVFAQAPQNVVLAGKNEYQKLLNAFLEKKRKGKPLVYCQQYRIKENLLYNIKDSSDTAYQPNICWVYLDLPKFWVNEIISNSSLSKQMRDLILLRKGELKHFPHYWTFFDDFPKLTLIDKSELQVRLLANLTAWTLRESALTIAGALGLQTKLPNDKSKSSCDGVASPDKRRYKVEVVD